MSEEEHPWQLDDARASREVAQLKFRIAMIEASHVEKRQLDEALQRVVLNERAHRLLEEANHDHSLVFCCLCVRVANVRDAAHPRLCGRQYPPSLKILSCLQGLSLKVQLKQKERQVSNSTPLYPLKVGWGKAQSK